MLMTLLITMMTMLFLWKTVYLLCLSKSLLNHLPKVIATIIEFWRHGSTTTHAYRQRKGQQICHDERQCSEIIGNYEQLICSRTIVHITIVLHINRSSTDSHYCSSIKWNLQLPKYRANLLNSDSVFRQISFKI